MSTDIKEFIAITGHWEPLATDAAALAAIGLVEYIWPDHAQI
jgi:hypothetical protein